MSFLLTRREFLSLASRTVPAWFLPVPRFRSLLPRLAFFSPSQQETGGRTLVLLFLRGGMDGLNAVIPYTDPEYYRRRPTLAVLEPKAGDDQSAIDLDGFFGLHPSLRPLAKPWSNGDLAILHACGSPDPTHSHFEAMDYMERGTPGRKQIATGWLARHLQVSPLLNQSPLRAVGIGPALPAILRGEVPATALQSIATFHLGGARSTGGDQAGPLSRFQAALADLYQGDDMPGSGSEHLLQQAADLTFSVSGELSRLDAVDYRPANQAQYPDSPLGRSLQQVAQLIKSDVGLEIAALDSGGWDTHVGQGRTEGQMPGLLGDLASGLAAFYQDLGPRSEHTLVLTLSEFGRRLAENGGAGTDHGHGNVMFLLGGGVRGGRVYGSWPGLEEEALYGPGDLAITTDFRSALGEVVRDFLQNPNLHHVFPEFDDWQNIGLF